MTKQKLIVITGPTGIGKSDLAIELATQFNGEIISADSMQIYRQMDIGTGKITFNQRSKITHHMLSIINPNESYSVGAFTNQAKSLALEILSREKLPFLVGGTGLYLSSLLLGHTFSTTPRNEALREKLNSFDGDYLHNQLQSIDPVSAKAISVNDKKRLVRALEIFYVSGKPKSQQIDARRESDYDYLLIVLTCDRAALYQKIELRVDKMLQSGLIHEVEALSREYGADLQSMQAIGYKELLEHLRGETTLAQAIDKLKMNTRRYAKRQITYFKNMPLTKHFFDVGAADVKNQIEQKIKQFIGKN